ncbi:amidohydrolase family protein [Luteirhabdus pelagi]|uniref:amidohydrolase family protein n=1 Tax=Luteirhabdus pelagi TaxID=2792783 RepID=UPI00193A1571|nr:amidohydrolase family protein [Luteirhabdus pelagi]
MKRLLLFLVCFWSLSSFSQDYFPKNDGPKEKNTNYTAFTNATIYVTPTEKISKGTLLIKDGKVVSVGKSVSIPENTVTIDLNGDYIYPSFIDAYTDFGMGKVKEAEREGGRSAQYGPSREGFYWNDHILAERNGIENFKYDKKQASSFREAGFGVVNTHTMDGIARGTGMMVALNDKDDDATRILEDALTNHFSFEKSETSNQSYPTSLMGAMALLRQLQHDKQWYKDGNVPTKDRTLEALIANEGMVNIFEAGSKDNDLRADKISDQFNLNYVIVGGGDEYERIDLVKNTNANYILPINFPDAYDVSDPYAETYITVAQMRDWNQAPMNPKVMTENGVPFALTTFELDKVSDFNKKLEKAFLYGYDKTKALEALTSMPAKFLGIEDKVGSLKEGRYANFLITSGPMFEAETTLYENWVQGEKHVVNTRDQKDIRGNYTMTAGGKTYEVEITGEVGKPKSKVTAADVEFPSKMEYSQNWVRLSFTDKENNEVYRTTGIIPKEGDSFSGKMIRPDGSESDFTATRTSSSKEKKDKDDEKVKPEIMPITYPNVGYGYTKAPEQKDMLFKNATVWTGEEAGTLENTDVRISDGKIVEIGKDLSRRGATVIDATGKHLTAGIIDEHSHIAALSINEAGQNSSAEVSIEDVVDPEDVSIYRNLAGGVTSIQILHGSANPIGGRSAIIKLKWGEDADGLIYDNSPKFIKFALGENVKQSNWGSYSRFPQTRMGVEQVYVNYFNRAKEYEAKKNSGQPYRTDEELEVLSEILNGERFISCHSYVQSEINMLMKVAERFDFNINTFTHILEGYKVADKMKEHGVGGSTFSDWWAYKYEVNDAIPYNAAIMHNQGVTVAINSDDAEMSRRLNQEAAKTVKYGGMSEEEAWKTVTLNPAKLLHIDDRVGSIKEGKDADLVLWNEHPLSVYAKPEKTIIEGRTYFDIEKDAEMRKDITAERAKLVKMMLDEKEGGGKTRKPKGTEEHYFHCNTVN